MPSFDRPLVSFVLLAYNQEKFIREAIEGALAQTYSPLEIVLSDDCSTDNTFKIIQETAEAYRGPHKIRLNRNHRNMGLVPHVVQLNTMAAGELIVASAGDDISIPSRTEVLVGTWEKSGRPSAACSGVWSIDSEGRRCRDQPGPMPFLPQTLTRIEALRSFAIERKYSLYGCSEAWVPSLFSKFGAIPEGVVAEDCVLALRAWLTRGIVFVPDRLVEYRRHTNNIWNNTPTSGRKGQIQRQVQIAKWGVALMRSHCEDVTFALEKGLLDTVLGEELQEAFITDQRDCNLRVSWLQSSVGAKIKKLFPALRSHELTRKQKAWLVRNLLV
jgi:glycosyltransferase involved in cell wall biosynthesis